MNQSTISEDEVLRPTNVEVDLHRLAENYEAIANAVAPAQVMVVLKANAYGHGLVAIARAASAFGAAYLGVAFLEEGILLRQSGITTPILVMGGIIGNQVPHFLQYDLTLTASSVAKLLEIENTAREMGLRAKAHLKIDTGMERIGTHYYNAEQLLEASLTCRHVEIEGIFSHFANADAADLRSARQQLERFNEVLSFYERHGVPRPPLCHMANSGAILQLPQSHFDLVRAGILFYGVYPSPEARNTVVVQPALSWKSRVVYFKVTMPNHPVSYGSTWTSERMTRVITAPVGYGDGYFRRLSDKAKVIIRGRRYPIVGRICMDQFMVDIGWETAYNGDEIILLGRDSQSGEGISCENLAEWADTIPYEILTNINTRVPRIYLNGEN